jgi:hypothetical protein
MGYQFYSFMEYRNHYKEDWAGRYKQDQFHFFTDKHFVFELNDGSVHHLKFSDVVDFSWAAVGGFFTHELICGYIHTSAGTLVAILISTPGQHMLRDSGLALTNIDMKVGVHLDKEYKEKAKREGKEWKKNLIKKLEASM